MSINPNPAGPGTGVTIAANVTPAQATGLITFYDGTTKLAGVGLIGGGAQYTSTFTTGTHQISASYAGDTAYFGTTSAQYPLVVSSSGTLASTVALTVNPTAASTNTLVSISGKVNPISATGSLVFTDNGALLGTQTISSGSASLPARLFSVGTHKIGCTYSGDTTYKPAVASPVTLSVNTTGTCSFAPITTLSAQTSNNTSACSSASYGYKSPAYCNQSFVGFNDTQAGVITPQINPAPANVSMQPISQLLYSGNTTNIFAELQAWFCTTGTAPTSGYNGGQTCGGHKSVGYNSNDANTVNGQIQNMIDRGFKGVVVDWYNTAIDSGRDDQTMQLISTKLNGISHTVDLLWTASTTSSFTSYNVKRSTTNGGPYTTIAVASPSAVSYTDNNVVGGKTYYYVVTAVRSGIESVNSNQATAVIPGTGSTFKFLAMEDGNGNPKLNCPQGATDQTACLVTQLNKDLDYLNTQYFGTGAYYTIGGRPAVQFFIDEGLWSGTNWCSGGGVWSQVATHVGTYSPVPLLFFQSSFSHCNQDGVFAWVSPQAGTSVSNQTNYGQTSLDTFYDVATISAKSIFGVGYKGFDDFNASWKPSPNRIMSQQCGMTLINSLAQITHSGDFSSAHQLAALQMATWNDYEEGTEVETGIDNCYSVTGLTRTGTILNWTMTSSNATYSSTATIDHFNIYLADSQNNLQLLGTAGATATSYDFGSACIPSGTWNFYVQMVGKPLILNRMSSAVSYTINPALSPTVIAISPNSGATAGGTLVTVTGTNFRAGAALAVGGANATFINVVSTTSITGFTPPHNAGLANVTVINTDATQGTLTGGFNYVTGGGTTGSGGTGGTTAADSLFSLGASSPINMSIAGVPCGGSWRTWDNYVLSTPVAATTAKLNPASGSYRFDIMQAIINGAKAAGCRVTWTMGAMPAWMTTGQPTDCTAGPYSSAPGSLSFCYPPSDLGPTGSAHIATLLTTMLNHVGSDGNKFGCTKAGQIGCIDSVEGPNEPNSFKNQTNYTQNQLKAFMVGQCATVHAFSAFVRCVAPAPQGYPSGLVTYLKAMFDNGMGSTGIDVIAWHSYQYGTTAQKQPNALPGLFKSTLPSIPSGPNTCGTRDCRSLPVWDTEYYDISPSGVWFTNPCSPRQEDNLSQEYLYHWSFGFERFQYYGFDSDRAGVFYWTPGRNILCTGQTTGLTNAGRAYIKLNTWLLNAVPFAATPDRCALNSTTGDWSCHISKTMPTNFDALIVWNPTTTHGFVVPGGYHGHAIQHLLGANTQACNTTGCLELVGPLAVMFTNQ